jgi:site-specific recombinase XerD
MYSVWRAYEQMEAFISYATFCSHLAMEGANARAIQQLAWHADLNTTMRYVHLAETGLKDAIRCLEP